MPRTTGKSLTKKERKEVKTIIKRQQNLTSELKFHDDFIMANGIPDTGVLRNITLISQGLNDYERVGDSIHPTSLEVRCHFTAEDTTNLIRFIVFRWLPQNNPGVSPLLSDILLPVAGTTPPYQHYNKDKRQEFQILKDFTVDVNTNDRYDQWRHFSIKLADKKCMFNAGSNTGTGLLYIAVASDSTVALHPLCSYYARLRYRDN